MSARTGSAGSGGGPAAALGTPGEGVRLGGGERRRGARAGRVTAWAREERAGRGKEIKVEIQRPRAREESRREGGEAERRGEGARRLPGCSLALAPEP